VYFGDTAHIPYGSKSRQAVTRYSLEARDSWPRATLRPWSWPATPPRRSPWPKSRTPFASRPGVIQPGAKAAAEATRNGRVGVIGTEATVASGAYAQALKKCGPSLQVFSAACPLFVPLVEEGWWNHSVTAQVARHYLAA